MIGMLYVNGQEIESTFGLIVASIRGGAAGSGKRATARAAGGVLGGIARVPQLLDVPSLAGSLDSGIIAEDTRGIVVGCMVQAASYTTLDATLDAIKEVCGTGLVELRFAYSGGVRAFYAILETPDIQQYVDTNLNGWVTISLAFTCPNPYALALLPASVAFTATRVAIPLGTAPSFGRDNWSALIEIVGAAATPVLTYRNYRGDVVGTMNFSGYSPLAGDAIVIDCGRRIVNKFVSGVRTNAMSALTAGYTFPPLDPGDANIAAGGYPTLEVSTGTASILYWKAYR